MKRVIRTFHVYESVLVLILLSFFAIKPLLAQGFFPMHDDTQVARVYEMTKSLKDGMFPVRWVPDLGYGYGYPIFNFYAPLSYYIGSLFSLIGFDSLTALKIMMGIGIVFSGISMYFLAREFWGEVGGVLSGMLYVYAPYHALEIYVRGDVAEFWAYAFIPLVFYAFVKLYKTQELRYVAIGSITYASIILSHNLTGLMVTLFIFVVLLFYCYFAYKRRKLFIVYSLLFTVFVGLLLSAFYWIPAILEMNYTNVLSQIGGGANFKEHFVCLSQLWESPWGFGGSTSGCIDGISFRIGKIHTILAIVTFMYSLLKWKKNKYESRALAAGFFGFLLSIFLLLQSSQFVWEAFPFMSFFQYPWRFLIMVVFFSSFMSGYFVHEMHEIHKASKIVSYIFVGIIISGSIINYVKLFNPQYVSSDLVTNYTNEKALQWTVSKISDEYMPKNFRKPNNENEVISHKFYVEKGDAVIVNSQEKTQYAKAEIISKSESMILIQTAYFPAWKIYIDRVNTPFKITQKGMEIKENPGKHVIEVKFEQTPLEKIANLMSLIGLFLLIIGIIRNNFFLFYEKTNG